MKIAMLTVDSRDEFWHFSDPDPSFGTAPAALLEGLAQIPECEIHVVCCMRKPVRAPVKLSENTYYHSVIVPAWGRLRGAYLGCLLALRKKLREIKPDLAHGQGTERYCALAAALSGFPNVVTIHGNMRLLAKVNRVRPFSFYWLAARLESFTLPRTNGVVCISRYTQQNVAALARRTWVVPNAVNSSYFDIDRKPARPKRVLCLGFITPRKNQMHLIGALEGLAAREKFELVFHGGGLRGDPYVEEFFRLLRDRPWCRYEGKLDAAGVGQALAGATLLILASLEDNCPMVVLEAMAAGVPVAAPRVGGVPDLVTDGVDGLLFDPTENKSISSAVERMLTHEEEAEQMAQAARKTARRRFHPLVIAREHLGIYRQVLNQG